MLSPEEAIKIVNKNHPTGVIQAYIEYGNVYLFQVFDDTPFEEEMDPFFSVDKTTGLYQEFSILTDGPTNEIVSLFAEAKRRR